jgi:FAD/FMN-containing dehydrogenase
MRALLCVAALLALAASKTRGQAARAQEQAQPPRGGVSRFVDDASRLNQTPVAEVVRAASDRAQAEAQIAQLLARAREQKLPVSIAGARHSMGGHTIYPGGIALDMTALNRMELDESKTLLHVQAGAKWSDVIPYLDARRCSVEVMQSNNSFSVGGSLSVNCHGWQYGRPPIASTVEAFRLMKADGSIVRCSRQENKELFGLALGGYGLFGVILDVDLRVIPNERLRLEQHLVRVDRALQTFDTKIRGTPNVRMVYARLNVAPTRFLQDVIINVLRHEEGEVPPLADPQQAILRRAIFRGSAESDGAKELRWIAEALVQPRLTDKVFSRNQLLNEGVETFQNRSFQTTDILHEYFLPRDGAEEFLASLREIVPRFEGNLLNVTVRHVATDEDTFLRYADQPMIAFVMLFQQARTAEGEAKMQAMTQAMIDAALARGGRYYLPYRLHATLDQFQRAYPQAAQFFELKRRHDPHEIFQSQFYAKYGGEAE